MAIAEVLPVFDAAAKFSAETNIYGTAFRDYENSVRCDTVAKTYYDMHVGQTVSAVRAFNDKWLKFDKGEYTIMEIITMLDDFVDDSDPDVDIPNSVHDFQTAERIRQAYPDLDWFHLVGLLHDVGKVLGVWGEPQWATVGDTYCVGCAPPPEIVHHKSFQYCADYDHPVYSTKYGIHEPKCGLDNLLMSWGHDEYMYRVLKENGCTIPQEGLDMIRFHSFYPWHTGGAYQHLTTEHDENVTKKWVLKFNEFDLYSKADSVPDIEAIKPYYIGLLEKYGVSGKLRW